MKNLDRQLQPAIERTEIDLAPTDPIAKAASDVTPSMRRDASRNHEAIVSAAISVLTNSNDASMLDIAAASGIGRTTLYRHFPDRRSLIEAILGRLINEVDETIDTVLAASQGESAITRVANLICAFAQFGDRYRFLQQFPEMTEIRAQRGRRESVPSKQRLRAEIVAGQRAGEIRDDLDPAWLTEVLISMVTSCWHTLPTATRDRDRTLCSAAAALLSAPG